MGQAGEWAARGNRQAARHLKSPTPVSMPDLESGRAECVGNADPVSTRPSRRRKSS